MSDIDNPVTNQERYLSAVRSSRLQLEAHRRGPGDVITAAGAAALCVDGRGNPLPPSLERSRIEMASLLYRLGGEYDAVRGDVLAAERALEQADAAAHEAEKTQMQFGPTRAGEDIRQAAADDGMQRQLHILGRLKTLPAARNALQAYAIQMCERFELLAPGVASVLAGHVLWAWLDPRCHACHGLKYTGGYLTPRIHCGHCKGTGKRHHELARDALQALFVRELLDDISESTQIIDKEMRLQLRSSAA